MILLVDDVLDKLTRTNAKNCHAYAWWEKHRGETFESVVQLWIDSGYFELHTAAMIVSTFWTMFEKETRKALIKEIKKQDPYIGKQLKKTNKLTNEERELLK